MVNYSVVSIIINRIVKLFYICKMLIFSFLSPLHRCAQCFQSFPGGIFYEVCIKFIIFICLFIIFQLENLRTYFAQRKKNVDNSLKFKLKIVNKCMGSNK